MERPSRTGPGTRARICHEIIHHVLPSRSRTVHLILLVSVPPVVLISFVAVLVTVLLRHPGGWYGVAGCGVGVLLVARLRRRLRPPRPLLLPGLTPEAAERPVPSGSGHPPEPPPRAAGEEEVRTSPPPR
jgi:hypothetical protein